MSGMAADRFGREITRVRRNAGITQSRLARMVGVSSSHLSNIERGVRTPAPALVGALDHALGEDGRLIRAWEDLTGTGRPAWLNELADVEREALSIQEFQLAVFSSLLQTEEYARALISGATPLWTPAQVENGVAERMARARRFASAAQPAMRLVIDGTVITRRIGGSAVMADQLAHVIQLVESGRISMQIINLARAHPGLLGPFKIISSATTPHLVYAESAYSGQLIDDPEAVQRYRLMFGDIQASALDPDDSLRIIRDEMESIRHG